jgi:hypothetical protein
MQVVRGIGSLFVSVVRNISYIIGASITTILISYQLPVLPHSASIGFGLKCITFFSAAFHDETGHGRK